MKRNPTLPALSLAAALSLALNIPALAAESSWTDYEAKAKTAYDQGQFESATENYSKSIALLEPSASDPKSAEDLSRCLNGLAAVYTQLGKSDEAAKLYKRSLQTLTRAFGANSPKLIQTMLDLGSIYESFGDHPAAMVLYNRVFAINQKKFGPNAPEVAGTARRIAHNYQDQGDYKHAEAQYKRALDILKNTSAAKPQELAVSLTDYAKMLKQQDRLEEAAKLEQEAAKLQSTITPGNDPAQIDEASRVYNSTEERPLTDARLVPMYSTLANVYFKQSKFAEAERMYKRLVEIDEASLGPDHPGLAGDLTNLGLLYSAEKRYSDAAPILERALQIYTSVYGSNNMLVAKIMQDYAKVLRNLNRTAEADRLEDQAKRVLAAADQPAAGE